VWAIVAHCLGASNVPRNFDQCWAWCEQWLPFYEKFHALGIAAICWAIWKTRKSVVLRARLLQVQFLLSVMLVLLWNIGQVCF